MPKIIQKTLPGFTKGNTLLGMSLCSDEINADFVKSLQQYYGPAFILGGLGGVPFVGVSGRLCLFDGILFLCFVFRYGGCG